MSSLPSLEVYQAAETARLEQVEALKDVEGVLLTMVIQPMASGAIKACEARGGTPMGLKAQNHQCTFSTCVSAGKILIFFSSLRGCLPSAPFSPSSFFFLFLSFFLSF